MIMDARTARVLVTLVAFSAAVGLVYAIRKTLVIFLFAILLAYFLDPAIAWVQRASPLSKQKRAPAIAQVYLALGIVVGAFLLWVGPVLIAQGEVLGNNLPSLLDNLTTGKVVWKIGGEHGWSYDTQLRLEQVVREHRDDILAWVKYFGFYTAHLAENIIWLVVIPILAIFFLKDGRALANAAIELFPGRRNRALLESVTEDMNSMLARFIRSQIILAGLSGVVYMAALLPLRYPFALVLAVASGFMEFVPVVGPLVAAISIMSVGFLASYPHGGVVLLILAVWRIIQDYVISPRILGDRMKLHPVAAVFAVMAGGELAGVLGVYLSIPVMAAIRIIWKSARRYSESSQISYPTAA